MSEVDIILPKVSTCLDNAIKTISIIIYTILINTILNIKRYMIF